MQVLDETFTVDIGKAKHILSIIAGKTWVLWDFSVRYEVVYSFHGKIWSLTEARKNGAVASIRITCNE